MTSSAHTSTTKRKSLFQANEIQALRVKRLPPYIFARINEEKLKLRREGKDVIDFGMGNPDIPTPQHIVDKLCEVAQDGKAHRYSASKGIPHLRRAICQYYKKQFQVELDPESEAIAVIGSKEGLVHLSQAIVDQGDIALVPNPAYPIHNYSIIIAGGNVVHMPITKENNYIPNLEEAIKQGWPEAKILILNYPNNPTCATVSLDFFQKVVDFAKEHRLIVIHDMAYSGIAFDDFTAPSFLQAKGAIDVGIEFYTMSKSYSMAGWRVGFCVGNPEVIKVLAHFKGYTDYGIFTPIQVASILALTGDQSCVDDIRCIYQARRDLLCEGLNKIGWQIEKPKAGMFIWAPIPEKFQHLSSMDFSLMLLDDANVSVSPGIAFGLHGEGYVRISMVENEDRIRQALKNIKKIM